MPRAPTKSKNLHPHNNNNKNPDNHTQILSHVGGNILVDSTGRKLRIADFGASARLASHTTDTGEFQKMEGTVVFMAPEVVRGGPEGYGRKCDVWSIGCVLIQMVTAKLPWNCDPSMSNFQLIYKVTSISLVGTTNVR